MDQLLNCDLRIYFADNDAAETARFELMALLDGASVDVGTLRLDDGNLQITGTIDQADTWVMLEFKARLSVIRRLLDEITTQWPGSDADAACWPSNSPRQVQTFGLRGGKIESGSHLDPKPVAHRHSSPAIAAMCEGCRARRAA